MTAGAMLNTLKKLVSKGLVQLEPDTSSVRNKLVTLTRISRVVRDLAIARTSPFLAEPGQAMNNMDLE